MAQPNAMEFRVDTSGGVCFECTWISASGEIAPDTPERFESFLKNEAAIKDNQIFFPILLDSPGGDLKGAFEFGRLLRRFGAEVSLGKSELEEGSSNIFRQTGDAICHSACAFAFLGGRDRYFDDASGSIGFHQFFDKDILTNKEQAVFTGIDRLRDQYVVGEIVSYLIEMEIEPDLYPLISGTPPNEMRLLSELEAQHFNVVNLTSKNPAWEILPLASGLMLQTESSAPNARMFCLKNQPDTFHFQILHRELPVGFWAGAPTKTMEEVLPFLNNLHAEIGKRRVPLEFGNIYDDTGNGFKTSFDFQLSRDDLFLFAGGGFIQVATESDPPPGIAEFFNKFLNARVPTDTSEQLLQIMTRNCP